MKNNENMHLSDFYSNPDNGRKAVIVKDIIYRKNQNVNFILVRQYCRGFKKYTGKKLRMRKIYAEYCRTHIDEINVSHKFLRYETVKQKIINERMEEIYGLL